MHRIITAALLCGAFYGAFQLIPAKAAPAPAAATGMDCKQLDSVYQMMASSHISVAATGSATINGEAFDIVIARAEIDGSWMMLAVDDHENIACLLVAGPKLTLATAS